MPFPQRRDTFQQEFWDQYFQFISFDIVWNIQLKQLNQKLVLCFWQYQFLCMLCSDLRWQPQVSSRQHGPNHHWQRNHTSPTYIYWCLVSEKNFSFVLRQKSFYKKKLWMIMASLTTQAQSILVEVLNAQIKPPQFFVNIKERPTSSSSSHSLSLFPPDLVLAFDPDWKINP